MVHTGFLLVSCQCRLFTSVLFIVMELKTAFWAVLIPLPLRILTIAMMLTLCADPMAIVIQVVHTSYYAYTWSSAQ